MKRDGQSNYQLDTEGLAGEPVFLPAEESRQDDDGHLLGLHFSTLFDQDEDEAGELVDMSTGRPYDNSTFLAVDGLSVVLDVDIAAGQSNETPEY